MPDLQLGHELQITWRRGAAVVGAERTVIGEDWSGYRSVEVTVPAAELGSGTRLRFIGADGSDRAITLRPDGRTRPVGSGRLAVTVGLEPIGAPLLSRIAKLRIEHRPRNGRAGTLRVGALSLTQSCGFLGPSTFLDPALSTYDYPDRRWSTIAARIRDQGFTAIHLIILDFDKDYTEIVDALHALGLQVSLTIFPTTNVDAYNQHPNWRQVSLGGDGAYSWRVYLSPTNNDFVSWLHRQVSALMSRYAFDGLTLDEPWYEVWGGPYRDNPEHAHYMDVRESARDAFRRQHGFDPLTKIFSKDDEGVYYLTPEMKDSAEYQQWVQFRIATINNFMRGIADAARAVRSIDVFLTYVADVRVPGGAGKSPEYQAQDIPAMQNVVPPQGMIIETAWQDWLQPDLDPSYVLDYTKAYVPQLEPGVLGLGQPDIGSVVQRDMAWVKEFSADCWTGGFGGYVIYEWSIGKWPTGGPPLDYGS
ncbi:hypothetical protein FOE78_05115 [Microlunatus elymi]|uniref:DUF4015 domain-containing protein n=1 Tax=Microlunatus elymi TaxID=2596828 RepID=A0A516PW12_9ACTN|nr:hypothetical protein [Microlunatus elymi]QDP95376.1 hypothetical protein FOE78_05115 [Microlunatus elymi]